jgi:zinc transporter ZupT
VKQSIAENKPIQPMDRSLMRSSQILTRTFTRPNEHNPDMDLLVNPIKSDIVQQPHEHVHHHEELEEKLIDTKLISNATPYLLLAALCLDGFFEGIALGIQSSWQNVLFVAGAIVINKIAVGFSLGISFKKSNTDIQTFIRFILLFSLFTPFGIVVGYFSFSNLLLKGILLAFSAGTFVYVSCSVVIVEEFAITRYRYSKYLCFLLGGLATVGISIAKQYTE